MHGWSQARILTVALPFLCAGVSSRSGGESSGARAARSSPAPDVHQDTVRPGRTVSWPSSPQDRSFLTVMVGNARLLIVDPNGAQTGLHAASGAEITEIPGSSVFVDAIDDDVTGAADTSFTVNVGIPNPEGTYRVLVVGMGRPSELRVDVYSVDGSAQPLILVPLSLEKGSRREFRLDVNTAPGSSSRLKEVKPGGGP